MVDCVFCRIVAGELPATVVSATDRTLAFRDTDPKAPTHTLVVPRDHHADVAALSDADPALLVELLVAAVEVARLQGVSGNYRLVTNTGPDAGQMVQHVHVHVLGEASPGAMG